MKKKPLVLCILDGWGEGENTPENAIYKAYTPCWDFLKKQYPMSLLSTSGQDVGLPEGQMGNSEVGHMTIGAGRVIWQDLPRINRAIKDGTLANHPQLLSFSNSLRNTKKACHLLGLLSPGGVHSHQDQILALCKILNTRGVLTYVHAFLDGRDTPPESAYSYIKNFLKEIQSLPFVKLASVGGRYYGMDRDERWDRIQKAYACIVHADAPLFEDPLIYIQSNYRTKITDEFIPPATLEGYQGFQEGDGLLIANFRADRMRQLLRSLLKPDFKPFKATSLKISQALGFVSYSSDLETFITPLFPPQDLKSTFGEVLSQKGFKQLRVAETEKYAHVTYFFNGGVEPPFSGEDRLLIPSPKVATYDLKPEMSAFELTEAASQALEKDAYDVVIMNYANTDMVGHTGDLPAAIKAVEAVDQCLGRLWRLLKDKQGTLVITADHGNAEMMQDHHTGQAHTAHTLNVVPLLICQDQKALTLEKYGSLKDVAPTLLTLFNIGKPSEMTGSSLIK